MAVPRVRLADLLVRRGDAHSFDEATRRILAGGVRVDGQLVTKPGTLVRQNADVQVRGMGTQYVSRGGVKLEHALRVFALDVRGRVALDAGASVGGFTDCLLQHGAARVYAVDVGFGQIRGSLTADPRVVALERTNISDLRREDLQPAIDLCTADLSYLSLRTALPVLAALFTTPVRIVALVKPLFEGVRPEQKADPEAIRDALHRLANALVLHDLHCVGLTASPVLGTSGTIELLALVTRTPGSRAFDLLAEEAIAEASRVGAPQVP